MSDLIIKYGGESPFIIKTNRMFAPLDVHSIGECGIVGGWIYTVQYLVVRFFLQGKYLWIVANRM